MPLPQKFFAFLVLPALTFVLGISFSTRGAFLPEFPEEPEVNTENEPQLDYALLETALEKWEATASPEQKIKIMELKENLRIWKNSTETLPEVNLKIFWEALGKIENKYVDPEKINFEKISEGVLRGLLYSLDDPYSSYLSKAETKSFDDDLAGELNGIGAELTMKNDLVTVVSPLKNTPAEEAGLLPGDVIVRVEGVDVGSQSLSEVVEKIRGQEGTSVKLTILRQNEPQPLEKEIMRRHIVVESVTLKTVEDIPVLEVRQFGDRTAVEFEHYLREAVSKNPRGLVLDLRFNPGGYLDTAVEMVSAFVKEGKVVIQQERMPTPLNKFVTGKVLTDLPLIVLINQGSASASEIVAGALQDYGRAIIIGEKSFGKGTVQEILPLSDGSNVRLTVAKWLTPNGRDISQKGIEPDIMIVRTPEDFAAEKDPQLDAALKILREEVQKEDFIKQ